MAIGLRPQPDASRHGSRKHVLQIGLAIEIGPHFRAGDLDLEIMPLSRGGRCVADPLHRRALALLEFPQDEVVLERIGADGQVIAVGLEVEQDPRALVDAPGNALEAYRDCAVAEIRHVLRDRVGKIRVGLDAIQELGIAVAVESARLVGDSGRGLAFLPLPAVDDQHLVVAIGFDPPNADDAQERLRLAANGLVREIDLDGLRRSRARRQRCQADDCERQCAHDAYHD